MKKYFMFLAAVAVMFATSCNKEEINAPIPTEFISLELNPMTKTQLNGFETIWSDGDEVDVFVGTENIGTLKLKEGSANRFEGEITAGKSGNAILKYPAGVSSVPVEQQAVANSFANQSALLEGQTTIEDLRAGNGATLDNVTALLKFKVAQDGDVTFEVGANKYTVKGCKTDSEYYACVAPASNVTLVARIGGYLSKKASKNVTFEANKISNLGTLPAPEKFSWGIVGQHQAWDITNPTPMYKVADKAYAVFNVTLKDNGFKFAKTGLQNWNTDNTYFGAWKKSSGKTYFNFSTEMGVGTWYGVYTNNLGGQSENIGVGDFSKKYDVYVKIITDADWGQELGYTVVTAGTAVTF